MPDFTGGKVTGGRYSIRPGPDYFALSCRRYVEDDEPSLEVSRFLEGITGHSTLTGFEDGIRQ